MNALILLPILIPLTAAIVGLLAWNSLRVQRVVGVLGSSGLLISAVLLLIRLWPDGIQFTQVGNWPAPFGITLVVDLFSALLVVVAGIVGLCVSIYSLMGIDSRRASFGYYPLLQVLLMGVCGAFITGDIFNLYVWFEVMLIASFVLLALGGDRAQLEGTIKYVTLNLMSSALFLAGVGIVYGAVGTLNMADLARQLGGLKQPGLKTTLAMLFLLAFGIKSAIFPLFFWLPASYHTPPAPVSAIFAGLLTKVGVYALIRVFTLIFIHDIGLTHTLILILAGLTMVTGILGALVQRDFRRVLAFNLVSHIGYMIMGLGLFTPFAIAGAIFYMVHDMIVKTGLFLVGGIIFHYRSTYDLKRLGGFYSTHPGFSLLFLVPALSLGGIPPLSGFWGKLFLVKAGLDVGQYTISAIALLVGILTLYSMVKVWSEAFWKDMPGEGNAPLHARSRGASFSLFSPVAVLTLLTLLMGLFVEPVFRLAQYSAEQLTNPGAYIRTVLENIP